VLSSVSLDDEKDVVPPGQQAQARRTHTKPGLAQSAKDLSSINPNRRLAGYEPRKLTGSRSGACAHARTRCEET
jgi:hypothetical protein